MTRAIRWGILGVAKINDRLIPGFKAATKADLVAIASRSLEKSQAAATAAGLPRAFGSYEELLADREIDAVYIPLPNTLHAEWTQKAADAGKHVLCEKPLTPTAGEAVDLVKYCESKGVRLMDGFMWPHHPRTKQLRQTIDAGRIGRVLHVHGTFTFMLNLDHSNIRLQTGTAGGSLLDVGCYPVFGIRWAFGEEPVRVYATARFEQGVDLSMDGILWFADGRTASFDCGFTMPMRQSLEITGERGFITIPQMWVPEPGKAGYSIESDEGVEQVADLPAFQIANMIDEISDAIATNRAPVPGPADAIKTLRVLDALIQSAREERVIDVR